MVAHNYLDLGKTPVILKPDKDTRWNMKAEVKSRAIVNSLPATLINDDDNLIEFVTDLKHKQEIDAILVEEAQFMTSEQVRQLAVVVDTFNIPVLCYGLRCSYVDGALFDASAALMYWADTIEEVKNVCQYCTSKATKNLLRRNGVPQYSGHNVVMGDVGGGEVSYSPVCRRHYLNPPPAESITEG
jgi:thymidine kinase